MDSRSRRTNRVALIILDGWGEASPWRGNAITQAKPHFFLKLKNHNSHLKLAASETAVGLPNGQVGNSEAGHINIGAGRVVDQDLSVINRAIMAHSLEKLPEMERIFSYHVEHPERRIHYIGLLSDGGVHSHIGHLLALLDMAKKEKLHHVLIHIIADGRDVAPKSLLHFLRTLEHHIKDIPSARIASVIGRFYAMDRDTHEERTLLALNLYRHGEGEAVATIPDWVRAKYSLHITDEMLPAGRLLPKDDMIIQPYDSVIMWNFRKDRAKQLLEGLSSGTVNGKSLIEPLHSVRYATFILDPKPLAITPLIHMPPIKNTLAEVLSRAGLSQLHIAETEKYAQVSYFFNGGQEKPFPNEDRILIDSGNFTSFTEKIEMRAAQIAAAIIDKLEQKQKYNFIVANFANADMVAHTADLKATILTVQVVDRVLSILIPRLQKEGYTIMVTADHGNAEEMIDPQTGKPDPSHTLNPVPFIVTAQPKLHLRHRGKLADIAPTILDVMNLKSPSEMTGQSLILK